MQVTATSFSLAQGKDEMHRKLSLRISVATAYFKVNARAVSERLTI